MIGREHCNLSDWLSDHAGQLTDAYGGEPPADYLCDYRHLTAEIECVAAVMDALVAAIDGEGGTADIDPVANFARRLSAAVAEYAAQRVGEAAS
jgi:hypothetical protein